MGGAVGLWQEFILSVIVVLVSMYGLIVAGVTDGTQSLCIGAVMAVLGYWFTKSSTGNAVAGVANTLQQHTAALSQLVERMGSASPATPAAPPAEPAAAEGGSRPPDPKPGGSGHAAG